MSDGMKDYTIRYGIGAHVYETVVRTTSSHAAIMWAHFVLQATATVVKEEAIKES